LIGGCLDPTIDPDVIEKRTFLFPPGIETQSSLYGMRNPGSDYLLRHFEIWIPLKVTAIYIENEMYLVIWF
jgi:hypothetical protein